MVLTLGPGFAVEEKAKGEGEKKQKQKRRAKRAKGYSFFAFFPHCGAWSQAKQFYALLSLSDISFNYLVLQSRTKLLRKLYTWGAFF